MDFSLLLTLVQIVSAIWVLVFGSKSVYDLVQSKSRQKGQVGQGLKISPLVLVNVVLAIGVLALSTTLLFLLRPPSPAASPYPPSGWKLTYSDPMKSNSSGYWPVSSDKYGSCSFTNDVYQVSSLTAGGYECPLTGTGFDFTNFASEVQMTITKGDRGDIIFRADVNAGNGYDFWISPSGTYGLEIGENFRYSKTLGSGSNAAINTGLNQLNTVAVVTQGNIFHLYVNDQLVDVVTDHASSFSHGTIVLEANPVNNPTQVFFSNVKVWTPSS